MNDTPTLTPSLAPPPGAPAESTFGSPPSTPTRGVRVAWLAFGSLFAVALLVYGTFSVVDVLAHERTTEVTTHEGVSAVLIESGVGTVQVRTADVGEITATAGVSEGLRATGVNRSVDGDLLVLRSSCPNLGGTWCSVDWEVVVPVGTDLTVRSDDDRAAAVGEFGAVDLRSEHGGVTFDGDAQSVVARSEHGNVAVRLNDPTDSVRAISENGNVNVVVPDLDEGYRMEVSSAHGDTDVGVRTDPNAARTIEARSEDGNVTVAPTP
jgi:hypothetical protein